MIDIEHEAKKIIYKWKKHCEDVEERSLNDETSVIEPQEAIDSLVGSDLFRDKELVKQICKQALKFLIMNDIRIAAFCSDEVRSDRDVALEIIKTNGKNLELLNDKLKDDKEFILEALQYDTILEYASERIRDDNDVVNLAVIKHPELIVFASDRFTGNKDFILNLLKKDSYVLQYLNHYTHNNLRNDVDFLLDCWKAVADRKTDNVVALQYHAKTLLEYMSDDLKPIFSKVKLGDRNISQQIESCFNHYILNQELNYDNENKTKKLKI
jgi:hypothetical protein